MEDAIGSKEAGRASAVPGGSGGLSRRLAVRGPEAGERQVMSISDAPGLEARVAATDGAWVYELRIPLKNNDDRTPYAVGSDPGRLIGVLLEVNDVRLMREEPRERQGAGGGARGGGRGGGMGGARGGGMGGRRRGGMGGRSRGSGSDGGDASAGKPRMPKPLRLTVRVRLAPAE